MVGWRISRAHDAGLKLQYDWNLKNFKAGLELFSRIAAVAEAEKHHPDLHLENYKKVRAEIWTHTVGMPPLKRSCFPSIFLVFFQPSW